MATPVQTPDMQGGAAQSAPTASQAPASPEQMVLAQMFQAAKALSQNPMTASGMQKVMAGIQEAQTALVTQAPSPAPSQTPPY